MPSLLCECVAMAAFFSAGFCFGRYSAEREY